MFKKYKKFFITVAVIAAFILLCLLLSLRKVANFSDKYEGVNLNAGVEGMERTGTYAGYLNSHSGAAEPTKTVDIDINSYESEGTVRNDAEHGGLFTDADSTVTWTVNVPEAGFYNLEVEYFLPESKGVAAERGVYINGELPFEDALSITFSRIWKDASEPKVDNQGNEIRPSQIEEYAWQTAYFCDDRGYVNAPYKFYFEKGENTVTVKGSNEPMIIKRLSVKGVENLKSYAEYIAEHSNSNGNGTAASYQVRLEGEDSTYRSESSLYAKYDRSSPTTSPNSVTTTVLNYVGGDAWRNNGMWIEWDFEVPEDGYYNIMIKGRQNYSRGSVSNRAIYIDGEVPFAEVNEVSFSYDNDWQCKDLADENGNKYNFYLTKGTHTIRVQATLGGLGEILSDIEDSTFRLNQMYRKVLVFTGATPDQYRDYKLDVYYPEIIEAMDIESKRLYKLVDDTVAYSGQKADSIATAQTLAQQLERFVKRPQKITLEFTTFKDNITSLGTASLNMSETKLDIDYIVVSGTDVKVKKDKSNVFKAFWHELKSFFASFVVDYNSVGDVYDGKDAGEAITVWVLTGRDQGTILKSMIDDDFTPNSGVKVNVEIVAPDALLNAVLAGRGPHVVLSVGANLPVDYALRGAAVDITQFEGWEEVLSHYSESSYEQYRLDGHVYGVPEQQTFNVMFYRKDVLEELELEIPNTWQELIEMLPTIQGNNLSVGIPSAGGSSTSAGASTAVASSASDLSMYFTLLYQYGGDMYNADGTKTTVDTEAGIDAFDDYVRYFNDYGIPVYFDFVSRFRSGEMPIGIAAYSTYNTLMVSAPEIRGLWDFTLIPGTEKVDEKGNTYIDRTVFITGNATMMLDKGDDQSKLKSWEFMKWWADADTQVRFGREIEALLGSSARYNTANRDAFERLSWSVEDIEVLRAQWDQTVGIREVPGGYYTGRHITNAIRKVINEKDDTRETIIDYSIKIDEEITKKRKEFGMP
ncbi:MAG: extracellular solute-binding protein, partial [Lachnospiraceae bacterium]|nr:extracellular solute-binding protein [Lachnospiraceae bacterium]